MTYKLKQQKGNDIASATTTDIGAATGMFVDITGTTTITGLGTCDAGVQRICQFDGVLTLTHNATSLILPSGADITTASGDIATFVSLGSGNWCCTSYQRADGTPLVGGGGGGEEKFFSEINIPFEDTNHWNQSAVGGTFEVTADGGRVSTTATGGRRIGLYGNTANNNNLFSDISSVSFAAEMSQLGTDGHFYVGIGNVAAPQLNNWRQYGFRIDFTGDDGNLYATSGDGTTEESTLLTTVDEGDFLACYAEMKDDGSVDYKYKLNGAAWSSTTNHSTNVPTTDGQYYHVYIENGAAGGSSFIDIANFKLRF